MNDITFWIIFFYFTIALPLVFALIEIASEIEKLRKVMEKGLKK